jgi:hypothetical protein
MNKPRASRAATPKDAGEQPKKTLQPVPVLDTMPQKPPRFFVHEDALHARDLDVQIQLRIKSRFVDEIEGQAPLDQLRTLAQLRLEDDLVEALDEMDYIDAGELALKFWQAFHEKEQARLGESFGSSDS